MEAPCACFWITKMGLELRAARRPAIANGSPDLRGPASTCSRRVCARSYRGFYPDHPAPDPVPSPSLTSPGMERAHSPPVFDVTEADFRDRVLERSRGLPVVVDFWAEWCAPCRALGPALEKAVAARSGRVELAKLDVDANPSLATQFGIQGIPAVKAFRGRSRRVRIHRRNPSRPDRELPRLTAAVRGGGACGACRRRRRRAGAPARARARPSPSRRRRSPGAPAAGPGRGPRRRSPSPSRRPPRTSSRPAWPPGQGWSWDGDPPRAALEAWDAGDHERALELLQQAIGDHHRPGPPRPASRPDGRPVHGWARPIHSCRRTAAGWRRHSRGGTPRLAPAPPVPRRHPRNRRDRVRSVQGD